MPGALLNGDRHRRLPGNASFCFGDVQGETILLELEHDDVYASSGSACHAGSQDPSHVLLAIGRSAELAHTAVRLTLGAPTTEAEIDRVLDLLPLAVERVRDPGHGSPLTIARTVRRSSGLFTCERTQHDLRADHVRHLAACAALAVNHPCSSADQSPRRIGIQYGHKSLDGSRARAIVSHARLATSRERRRGLANNKSAETSAIRSIRASQSEDQAKLDKTAHVQREGEVMATAGDEGEPRSGRTVMMTAGAVLAILIVVAGFAYMLNKDSQRNGKLTLFYGEKKFAEMEIKDGNVGIEKVDRRSTSPTKAEERRSGCSGYNRDSITSSKTRPLWRLGIVNLKYEEPNARKLRELYYEGKGPFVPQEFDARVEFAN